MDFSIMFWGDVTNCKDPKNSYDLMLRIGKYVDENGYAAIWLPERHFHPWGGLHPNPSVLAAALAVTTSNVKLRAGSVVLPLHSPFRVVEEWSIVDNLSHGRVELAFATGWKDDDFVLAPESYKRRRQDIWDLIGDVSTLWRGESITRPNGIGIDVSTRTYPKPLQPNLPIWVTSAGSLRTISDAGMAGYGLLTHLLDQDYNILAKKIEQYRAYRARGRMSDLEKIALMVHAFVGRDKAEVKNVVREAMNSFLLNSADLSVSHMARAEWNGLDSAIKAEMVALAFERYFETASLMGSIDSCKPTLKSLADMGVTEVCCLIDFGLPLELVLDHLKYLTELKDGWRAASH